MVGGGEVQTDGGKLYWQRWGHVAGLAHGMQSFVTEETLLYLFQNFIAPQVQTFFLWYCPFSPNLKSFLISGNLLIP